MTLKISMAAMNWKSLPNFLVFWYETNVTDDLEFILLYDYSQSRKIHLYHNITNLYWKYLNTEFRFAERDIIPRLSEALQMPHKIVCCQETVANNIEAFHILLLKKLSYTCRLSHMVPLLGRNTT